VYKTGTGTKNNGSGLIFFYLLKVKEILCNFHFLTELYYIVSKMVLFVLKSYLQSLHASVIIQDQLQGPDCPADHVGQDPPHGVRPGGGGRWYR